MRLLLALALLCVSAAPAPLSAADSVQRLAFERGGGVWVANVDGTQPRKIAAGAGPDLSPDGSRLAFNTEDPSGKTPTRRIAVADLSAEKPRVAVFDKGVPSDNCHSPIWSPDGSRLLFEIYADGDWHLGCVNADGSGFRYVKRAESRGRSFWAPAWAADGQSFFCHDLERIFRVKLDGTVEEEWALEKLIPRAGLNSGDRLAASADGKRLLVDVDMDERVTRKDWDGPPSAIWEVDLAARKARRISPPSLYAWDARWLSAGQILFSSMAAGEKNASIYRMNLDGKDRKLLIRNGRTPSASGR